MIVSKGDFTLSRFDSLLSSLTRKASANLLVNGNFGNGFTGWATHTNWLIISATSLQPNGIGGSMLQASDAAKGTQSTLETDRIAISANVKYTFSILFASPDTARKRANNLFIRVRWYDAPSGGSVVRADILHNSNVKARSGGFRQLNKRLTAPAGATHVALQFINTYGNSNNGVNKGVLLDDLFIAGTVETPTLAPLDVWQYAGGSPFYFRSLKFGYHCQRGCKALTLRVYGSAEYIWHLLNTALGQHIELAYASGRIWAGMVYSLNGRVGNRSFAASLDSMANYVKIPFGKGGSETYHAVGHPDSIQRYGRKDLIADKTFTLKADADAHAAFLLNEFALPKPTSADVSQDEPGRNFIDLEVMGYFTILGWVTGLQPIFTGKVDSSAAAATLASAATGGRSILDRLRTDTPNDFISADYSNVDTTGILVDPYEGDERVTSLEMLQEIFERGTLNTTTDQSRGIVAGVDADRKFFMHKRPKTLLYSRRIDTDGKYSYYDIGGNEVPRPLIQVGNFYTESAPFPNMEVIRGSDAANDFANRFILEMSYSHEENAVQVTAAGWRKFSLDLAQTMRIARGERKGFKGK